MESQAEAFRKVFQECVQRVRQSGKKLTNGNWFLNEQDGWKLLHELEMHPQADLWHRLLLERAKREGLDVVLRTITINGCGISAVVDGPTTLRLSAA